MSISFAPDRSGDARDHSMPGVDTINQVLAAAVEAGVVRDCEKRDPEEVATRTERVLEILRNKLPPEAFFNIQYPTNRRVMEMDAESLLGAFKAAGSQAIKAAEDNGLTPANKS